MKGISPEVDKKPPSIASYMAPKSQSSIPESVSAPRSCVLPSDWITLNDITLDRTIRENWEIRYMIGSSQPNEPRIPSSGPVLLRRSVVIKDSIHVSVWELTRE